MTPPFNKPRGIQGEERREGQLEYFTFLTSQGLAQGDIYCFAGSCGYHRKDFKVIGKCPAKCLRGSLEGKGPLVKLHRVKAFISMSLREFRILKTEFLGIDSILLTLEIWGGQGAHSESHSQFIPSVPDQHPPHHSALRDELQFEEKHGANGY